MLKTDIIKRVEQKEAERITERINRSNCLFNYGEIRISLGGCICLETTVKFSGRNQKKK